MSTTPEKAGPKKLAGRTYSATKEQAIASRAWFVVDATDKPLGRLASEVARVLRGKHKPTYTPHQDTGDFVIVVNAGKVKLTGQKLDKKFYYRHSGIPGGFRAEAYRDLLDRKPEFPIEKAVKGMLPKNVLGREMLGKLKVYATPDHPHAAQKPQALTVNL
ncbi:MAG: 50S ribosomal protein L13 [Myxococcales bacterium]|jgi:large subunit ribosomal protein L13|nr:50S ribosomal protein L13 [Myxococcales bacterium]